MMHVKQIKDLFEKGQTQKAQEAIENLLILGPKNIAALKLKAQLLHGAGQFDEEFKVWERILEVDREDTECIAYFQARFMQEQERFYFVDEDPEFGKTFFAYPRNLIKTSAIGLLGCCIFLMIPVLTQTLPFFRDPAIVLGSFIAFVLLPWFAIIRSFFKSLKSINLSDRGLTIATRISQLRLSWSSVDGISLVQGQWESTSDLFLLIEIKADEAAEDKTPNKYRQAIVIDLAEESSNVRARPYFLKELKKYFPELKNLSSDKLPLESMKVTYY